MPRLDCAALLAASILLPACAALESGQIARSTPAPQMPAVEVVRANESDEPPLAPGQGGPATIAILPHRAETPVGEPNATSPANDILQTKWAIPEANPTEGPLVAALRCYLNRSPEQAARCLDAMEPSDREMLAALLPLAVRVADGGLKSANPEDIATVVTNMDSLIEPLRERAALEVPKLFFCRATVAPSQFGGCELLEENHRFRPGEWVGLYVEVRNFTSAPHGDDYRTAVRMTIEVRNDKHQVAWTFDPPAVCEHSLSPRQDYCHLGRFALPANLPAGAYTLVLKVSDVPTGRTTQRSLDFRVTTVKDVKSGGEG